MNPKAEVGRERTQRTHKGRGISLIWLGLIHSAQKISPSPLSAFLAFFRGCSISESGLKAGITAAIATMVLLNPACLPAADKGGPVALFDGKSMAQWTMKQEGGWKIEDGALSPNEIKRDNYLWTKEQYGDFALELEFKMSESCNSGVFFRTDPANPVQAGFEIQVFDSHGKAEVGVHDCGALYDARAPKVNAAKPAGEWNKMHITAKGSQVKVELNGKVVVEANLDEWSEAQKNPDGSKNKFKTALKDLPRTGHIGLQYHGHPVWFRNVRVKAL